jgi:hypothetical protein
MYDDDVPDRSMKRKTLLQAVCIVGGLVVVVYIVFAVTVGASGGKPADGTATSGAHGGGPTTDEEKAVAEWVEGHNGKGGKISWLVWGPNADGTVAAWKGSKSDTKTVRVRYSTEGDGPKTVHDEIYTNGNGLISLWRINRDGDGWLNAAKAEKAAIENKAAKGP